MLGKILKIFSLPDSRLEILVLAFIVFYTVMVLLVSLNRYYQSQIFYFDFGVFDEAIWKAAHFQIPTVDHPLISDDQINIFAVHFYPSIFLLTPLFWFTDKSELLIIVQTLAVSTASYFAYLVAKKSLKSNLATFALVFAFLGYVGMQNALITEFHDATVAVLPLTVLFWSLVNKKWKLYFLTLVILLGFKETFAGLGVGLGIYAFLYDRGNLTVALLTILISFIWGAVALKIIMPHFTQNQAYLYSSTTLPQNIPDTLNQFIYPDSKLKTIFYTYLSFGILPIFDLKILPAVLDNFAQRFILSSADSRWSLGFHYNAPLSPLMFMGALSTLLWLQKSNRFKKLIPVYGLSVIFTVIFLHRFVLHGPLGLVYNKDFYRQIESSKYVDEFAKNFPKDGVIMAQNDLAARLTHQDLRILRINYEKINPDYVILNLTPGLNPNSYYPYAYGDVINIKNRLTSDKNYRVNKYGDELYIFTKNI